MKYNILIEAFGDDNWIGGLYYYKNIIFSLLSNKCIVDRTGIVVISESRNKELFSEFEGKIKFIGLDEKHHKLKQIKIVLLCKLYRCKYIFPNGNMKFKKVGITPIAWIQDFQHLYYPEFFNKKEIEGRNRIFQSYANSNIKLILSSNSANNDFLKFYNRKKAEVYVVRFVSYIVPIIRALTKERENHILQKYNIIDNNYICIMNQFWQHKNHIVVLEAMKIYFEKNPDTKVKFVFTGKLEDFRSPEYIERIKALFEDDKIARGSVLLGFIDRNEQIAIMKNAAYVIQPSLFEGWGTVVEDAKVLDKTILLSDIPVHREQMNSKCILFDPHDPITLAKLIEEENRKVHHDDVEAGIVDMYRRAKEYSKGFEQLLKDTERK